MSPELDNKHKLESFFKDEYDELRHYVRSRVSESASKDAEDIIQDVAYNLFAGASGYGPISNVAGFVYRSVKNKIVDVLRRKQPEHHDVLDYEWAWQEFAELMYSSDTEVSPKLVEELKAALKQLPKADFQILMAIDFEGYRFKEIAKETGIPEGTLMSRRHRALSKLQKQLKTKNT